MKSAEVPLIGWQSWSDCARKQGLFSRIRNYSPFNENNSTVLVKKQYEHCKILGWCSWNAFAEKVNENALIKVAEWVRERRIKVPIEYILIDDGWAVWGDWTTPVAEKFPSGIAGTVDKIAMLGFKTGLWIAPLLVDPQSHIVKEHPDWFVANSQGKFINGKKNYFFDVILPNKKYIVDLKNEDAYRYVVNCFRIIVKEWKVKLLKVDFLYAGHFDPRHQSSDLPDFLLRKLLIDIKKIDKHVKIIACGCPLKPAVGVVDAMRISDDVIVPALKGVWLVNHFVHKKQLDQLKKNYALREKTRNLWLLDPDMFVCHSSYGLTDNQLLDFQNIVANSRGVTMLGDNLLELTDSELEKYIYPLFK